MFICRHFRNEKELGRVGFLKVFLDRYRGHAIQLLANLIALCLVTISEVFEKVNLSQFLLVSKVYIEIKFFPFVSRRAGFQWK